MEEFKIRSMFDSDEKLKPLAMALIAAATSQGASLKTLQEASEIAISVFRSELEQRSLAESESDAQAAFQRFAELPHANVD